MAQHCHSVWMSQSHATPAPSVVLPLLAGACGIGLFTLMDAYMKGLTRELNAYNAMLWRSLIGLALSAPLFLISRGRLPPRAAFRLHSLRALNSSVMAIAFFYGISTVPLAEGTALTFIAPIIALFLASVLLHEKIHPLAIVAAISGFGGVMIIALARAQATQTSAAWLPIAALMLSAVLYAINIILMRQQAQAAGPVEIIFFQSLLVTLILSLAAPRYATLPNAAQFLNLAISSALALTSLLLLSWAYARAQAQQMVPVEYTAFLWATLFGSLFFDEIVTPVVIAGTVLIVGGCLVASRAKVAPVTS